jgi:hypothetical protein
MRERVRRPEQRQAEDDEKELREEVDRRNPESRDVDALPAHEARHADERNHADRHDLVPRPRLEAGRAYCATEVVRKE